MTSLTQPRVDCTRKSAIGEKLAVFYPMRKNGRVLIEGSPTAKPSGNICLPINIDTEFYTPYSFKELLRQSRRKHLTTQVSSINTGSPKNIFQSEDVEPKHYPVAKHSFHAIDYLDSLGYEVTMNEATDKEIRGLPRLQVVIYAHFALAEMAMIGDETFSNYLVGKTLVKSGQKDALDRLLSYIEMRRRLRSVTPTNNQDLDHIELPYIVSIDGVQFALELCIIDTGAIIGMASYKDFCEVSGVTLEYKDLFTTEEKSMMDVMFRDSIDRFDPYAKGDLYCYDALVGFSKLLGKVYEALDIEEYYKGECRLTIGSTVKELFTAKLLKIVGIPANDRQAYKTFNENFLTHSTASTLRLDPRNTKALLSKVEGGRCRNNQPTLISIKALLADLDINGCYGEGQRVQPYMLGNPEIMSYPATSKRNQYWTLREFLKAYENELVPGCWFAKVSSTKRLDYPQDFFNSWFLPNGHSENLLSRYACNAKNDTDDSEELQEFDEEKGQLKIFNYEIYNGTLTHDGLQFILTQCSTRQRKELLDNLVIKASIVYPASAEVSDYEALTEGLKSHKGKNKVRRVKERLEYCDGEYHGWYRLNLGDLLINDLLANRKLYPKQNADDTKNPENAVYKLIVNTLYGDMTSKYFEISNVCVGNNITGRARALAYYMEKGLVGAQPITDGCVSNINEVLYPKANRRLLAHNLVDVGVMTGKELNNLNMVKAPLCGYTQILIEYPELESRYKKDGEIVSESKYFIHVKAVKDDELVLDLPPKTFDNADGTNYIAEPARDWIDTATMEHLQNLFPDVDVLHQKSTVLSVNKSLSTPGRPHKVFTERVGQFSFEVKDFYTSGTFHGSANYRLKRPGQKPKLAMRSYETKKPHQAWSNTELGLKKISRYTPTKSVESLDKYNPNHPAALLHDSLESRPENIERANVFTKSGIIKPGLYKTQGRFRELGLQPGDNYIKPGLLRECSLSQFTFNTFEQWKAWNHFYVRNKDKYGHSFEECFLNEDGTLNYREMVDAMYEAIRGGSMEPAKLFKPSSQVAKSKAHIPHPALELYESIKEELKPADK